MGDPALNIDSIIARLLEGQYLSLSFIHCDDVLMCELLPVHDNTVRGARPGKNVQLTETEIKSLCMKSREIFLSQPILLELEAPLKICGMFIEWQ